MSEQQIDPWGMAWVHQVYRREFRLMPDLVRGVAADDRDRAAVVAEHIIDMTTSLEDHHQNEDDILWPRLLERAAPEADVVHRMESQHEQLHKLLVQVHEQTPAWRDNPTAESRDSLADLLSSSSQVLDEHLLDEEQHLMPLVHKHIKQSEWMEFERAGHEATPPEKALVFLGLGLEDATPHEKKMFTGGLPPEVLEMWEQSGKDEYDKIRANLLGR